MLFRPTPSRLVAPVLFVVGFFAWTGIAGYVLASQPMRGAAWPGYALIFGVPFSMLCLSCLYLLYSVSIVEVDRERIRIRGPLGSREVRWSEIEGYSLQGTEKNGIRLLVRGGKTFPVEFAPYGEADRMLKEILSHVPKTDPLRTGPLRSRHASRVALPVVSAVVLGLLLAATVTGISRDQMLPFATMVGMTSALLIPICGYVMSYEASMDGAILATSSCFGRKSVDLRTARSVELAIRSNKGGKFEVMTVQGADGKRVLLTGMTPNYVAFREAVLALVPSSIVVDRR